MLPNLLQLQHNNDKFHKYVVRSNDSNCCWTWLGYTDEDGFGTFQFNHNEKRYKVRAHRASYMLTYDKRLDRSVVLRQTCDNRKCVNPEHIVEGGYTDVRKIQGAKNGRAKLDEEKVREIKTLIAAEKTTTSIADQFQVSRRMIQLISQGKSWAHVQ